MYINFNPSCLKLPAHTNFRSMHTDNNYSAKSANTLKTTLLGLALLGASLVPTSCSKDDFCDPKLDSVKTEYIENNSIPEDCLDEKADIQEKANFILHQLGIIDEDKRISDVAEISFTDSYGEKYVLNSVGENEYGAEFTGTAEGLDGVKRYAKLRLYQGNSLIDKQVGVSAWHNSNHDQSYIKQVGWKDVDGKYQAVFHEFRPAVNSSERGKYNEYIHNSDNEYELVRTPDGFISKAIGKNPGTPTEVFSNLSVKYKTGEETEEPIVSVVDPEDITVTVTYDY